MMYDRPMWFKDSLLFINTIDDCAFTPLAITEDREWRGAAGGTPVSGRQSPLPSCHPPCSGTALHPAPLPRPRPPAARVLRRGERLKKKTNISIKFSFSTFNIITEGWKKKLTNDFYHPSRIQTFSNAACRHDGTAPSSHCHLRLTTPASCLTSCEYIRREETFCLKHLNELDTRGWPTDTSLLDADVLLYVSWDVEQYSYWWIWFNCTYKLFCIMANLFFNLQMDLFSDFVYRNVLCNRISF